jgi:hypothetical protein
VALLAAKALHFADGHAFDADFGEGILDLFEFERFDDCFDFFHFGFWFNCARPANDTLAHAALATPMPTPKCRR